MAAKPVIVGTDGSEVSLRAVEWAAAEAARRSVPLRIVSVMAVLSPAASGVPSPDDPPAALDDLMRNVYAQSLSATAEHIAAAVPGLPVQTDLLDGSPGRTLAGQASEASMLVVGAYGVGGYAQPGAGPEARYVAAHADCPIAIVRDHGRTVAGEVVAGVRDVDDAADVLQFAFDEAAVRGARLLAIHAWFPPALLHTIQQHPGTAPAVARWHIPDMQDSVEAALRLADGLREWQHKYPSVEVSHKTIDGQPGRVLAAFSGLADLTVVGRHDGSDGWRPRSGSILHTVLNHAHGPVAVVPFLR